MPDVSLITPLDEHASGCGYCGSRKAGEDTSHTYGAWAHFLTCEDYQALIDRGWRRSGHYMYQPNLLKSCCPQYSIRLDSHVFKASKQHRQVVNKFNRYIRGEWEPEIHCGEGEDGSAGAAAAGDGGDDEAMMLQTAAEKVSANMTGNGGAEITGLLSRRQPAKTVTERNKPKKAQVFDLEDKVLYAEQHCNDDNVKHRFRTVLEPAAFTKVKFELYKKYQVVVHKDKPSEVTEKGFKRFLCESPLIAESGMGSFHMNYYLDDHLIAIAVLDILPQCVSSVYFLYDPDMQFLGLGKFSALREIQLARELSRTPHLSECRYYYMGFYIHRCPKMVYKGQFKPSELLDPIVFEWVPLESVRQQLDSTQFTSFVEPVVSIPLGQSAAEGQEATEPEQVSGKQLDQLVVLWQHRAVHFKNHPQRKDAEAVHKATQFVQHGGMDVAARLTMTSSLFVAATLLALAASTTARLSGDIANVVVDAHNSLRRQYGVGNPISWDGNLASFAQNRANYQTEICGLSHEGSDPYGENLSMGSDSGVDSGSVLRLVNLWVREGPPSGSGYNHFSQMAWAGTSRVGCAVAEGCGNLFLACNYDPPGNMIGEHYYTGASPVSSRPAPPSNNNGDDDNSHNQPQQPKRPSPPPQQQQPRPAPRPAPTTAAAPIATTAAPTTTAAAATATATPNVATNATAASEAFDSSISGDFSVSAADIQHASQMTNTGTSVFDLAQLPKPLPGDTAETTDKRREVVNNDDKKSSDSKSSGGSSSGQKQTVGSLDAAALLDSANSAATTTVSVAAVAVVAALFAL
ncbi:Arginyl-tRNA--protein transferase 1 [Sorochytrium milnesiophthora]